MTRNKTHSRKRATVIIAARKRRNSTEEASAAGAQYAQDQISGDYFANWVRDQIIEASRMDPKDVLPLETKSDALEIAKNMLQQLEWDTKRAGAAQEQLGNEATREEITAFYDGFKETLRSARDGLADELLELQSNERGARVARETPRASGHRRHRVSGSGTARRGKPVDPTRREEIFAALWQDPKYLRLHARKDELYKMWNRADADKNTPSRIPPEELERLKKQADAAARRISDYEDEALKKAGV